MRSLLGKVRYLQLVQLHTTYSRVAVGELPCMLQLLSLHPKIKSLRELGDPNFYLARDLVDLHCSPCRPFRNPPPEVHSTIAAPVCIESSPLLSLVQSQNKMSPPTGTTEKESNLARLLGSGARPRKNAPIAAEKSCADPRRFCRYF